MLLKHLLRVLRTCIPAIVATDAPYRELRQAQAMFGLAWWWVFIPRGILQRHLRTRIALDRNHDDSEYQTGYTKGWNTAIWWIYHALELNVETRRIPRIDDKPYLDECLTEIRRLQGKPWE